MLTFAMKHKKRHPLHITERDFLLANRKAAREEEIAAHGKQILFRSHIHKLKKRYDRNESKRAIITLNDGSYFFNQSSRRLSLYL